MRTNTGHLEDEANGIKHRCTQIHTDEINTAIWAAARAARHSASWPSAAIHASPSGRHFELPGGEERKRRCPRIAHQSAQPRRGMVFSYAA